MTWLGFRLSRSGLRPGPKMQRRLRHKVVVAAARDPRALEQAIASYRALWEFGGG